jgi:hypothetical protein
VLLRTSSSFFTSDTTFSAIQRKVLISLHVKICKLLIENNKCAPKVILCFFGKTERNMVILYLHFTYKIHAFITHIPIGCTQSKP